MPKLGQTPENLVQPKFAPDTGKDHGEAKPPTIQDQIIEALKSGDRQALVAALVETNRQLTGLEQANFQTDEKGEYSKLENELNGFTSILYGEKKGTINLTLGDGGVSRLKMYIDRGRDVYRIFPDDQHSNDDVIRRWEELNY